MKTDVRVASKEEEIAIVFVGKTFEIKDTLKENDFRFDRNEIDWCGLGDTTGRPLWYKVIKSADMSTELRFTQQLVNNDITMIVAYASWFK